MTKSGFSHLKLSAVVAVLAMAIIGLTSLLSRTTVAREKSTTTHHEIAATLEEKSLERVANVLATEGDTTTPALPTTPSCFQQDLLHITAIDKINGPLNEPTAIEVRWDFLMPPEIASTSLSQCVSLDYFDVQVRLTFQNGSSESRSQKLTSLAANAGHYSFKFLFTPALRDLKSVGAQVNVHYKFTGVSSDNQRKDF